MSELTTGRAESAPGGTSGSGAPGSSAQAPGSSESSPAPSEPPVRQSGVRDDGGPAPERIWTALEDVMDPELPISLVDLGLIYDVRVDGKAVELDITFTAMGCPCVDFIQEDIRTRLHQEPNVESVTINIVWDPPWTKERLSDRARAQLQTFGVSV